MIGAHNLSEMFGRADAVDREEGRLAYFRYHELMMNIAKEYGAEFNRTVAAFVALSPNNDYDGNLRSLISILIGLREGRAPDQITISTYGHCKMRAYEYLSGRVNFLDRAKGLKIRSFYYNIIDPTDNRFVTVDGHISAIWKGENLTMKDAIVRRASDYREIERAIKSLAFNNYILPNQYQATLWFARKRIFKIKFDSQLDLLLGNNQWRAARAIAEIKPYAHTNRL